MFPSTKNKKGTSNSEIHKIIFIENIIPSEKSHEQKLTKKNVNCLHLIILISKYKRDVKNTIMF